MAEHNILGKQGETAAATYLMLHEYSILARNWRCGHYEIDIVAMKRGVLAFVEVKTSADSQHGDPAERVGRDKERYLRSAANAYINYHGIECTQVRFDIISVVGRHEPFQISHIENAFRPEMTNLARPPQRR